MLRSFLKFHQKGSDQRHRNRSRGGRYDQSPANIDKKKGIGGPKGKPD
jgi:hypothetical protein